MQEQQRVGADLEAFVAAQLGRVGPHQLAQIVSVLLGHAEQIGDHQGR